MFSGFLSSVVEASVLQDVESVHWVIVPYSKRMVPYSKRMEAPVLGIFHNDSTVNLF